MHSTRSDVKSFSTQWKKVKPISAPTLKRGPSTWRKCNYGTEHHSLTVLLEFAPDDVVIIDLGVPVGSEAGFERPGIVVSASGFLQRSMSTIVIVSCTTNSGNLTQHVDIVRYQANGLSTNTWAQCEHIRTVGRGRCVSKLGNVGVVVTEQIREVLALLIDIR